MKYFSYLIIWFLTSAYSKEHKNNVCPSNWDYNTKIYNKKCWYNSDQYLSTPEIIQKYNYPSEEHQIISDDGYILSLFRIPHGKNIKQNTTKNYQPVLCLHGIFLSSAIHVLSKNKSIGFVLADQGYDVWMLDSRGNTYSKGHVKYSSKDVRYWNFSYHEMGIYDLPKALDFIHTSTGRNDIIVIGMSMGTNIQTVYASMLPEHAKRRVKFFVHLAPIVFLLKMKLPIALLTPFYPATKIYELSQALGYGELLPKFPTDDVNSICYSSQIQALICELLVLSTSGFDFKNMGPDIFPVFLGHFPAGTSIKTLTHVIQNKKSKRFSQFDYGHRRNKQIYNSNKPPNYNLSKVTIPGLIIYGVNDFLASKTGSYALYNALPKGNNIIYEIKDKHYTHFDFYFAKNAVTEVYDYMIKIMNNYKTIK